MCLTSFGDWETTTPPTCKDEGAATQTCKFCTKTQNKILPKATEHSWDDGVVSKPATTEAIGDKTFTCKICQATKTETIPVVVSSPNTGDSFSIALSALTMVLSMSGAALVIKKKVFVK